ncbi:MAG: hypothetical protein MI923_08025 [Phycisphaerales bacterium]|nr:hypothetical protein [Phycisphaerales bacterium]
MADVYPNEAFPSESAVALLDGTTDQKTGLPYIAKGTGPASVPSYEIQYNRRQQRENNRLAILTEGLVVDEGGLKFGVYPCNYTLRGQQKRFPGATNQSMPDNVTRHVYIDSANTLHIADAYPADSSIFVPLAKVVTLNGAMTIQPDIGYARTTSEALVPQLGVTVAGETSDTISITFQLEDLTGHPIARRWLGEIWLSDADFGDLTATAPNGGVAITTGQQLGSHLVLNKHVKTISDANGTITLNISDTGTPTFYAMAVAVGSTPLISTAITFE